MQKRVELMSGVDWALIASKNRIAKMALVSGQSDFTPEVEAVKHEGVLTTLWHGSDESNFRPSSELSKVCDEQRELTTEIIQSIRRD